MNYVKKIIRLLSRSRHKYKDKKKYKMNRTSNFRMHSSELVLVSVVRLY